VAAIALQTYYQEMAHRARHDDGKRHAQIMAAERETQDSWRHQQSMTSQQAAAKQVQDGMRRAERVGVTARVEQQADKVVEQAHADALEDWQKAIGMVLMSIVAALSCATLLLLAKFSVAQLVPDCADFLAGASGSSGPLGLGYVMDWATRNIDFVRLIGYSQCYLWFALQVVLIVGMAYIAGMFSRELQSGVLCVAVLYASRTTLAAVVARAHWALPLVPLHLAWYAISRLTATWTISKAEKQSIVDVELQALAGSAKSGAVPADADPVGGVGAGTGGQAPDGTLLASRLGTSLGALLLSSPALAAAPTDRRGLLLGCISRRAWLDVLLPLLAGVTGCLVGMSLACSSVKDFTQAVTRLYEIMLVFIGKVTGNAAGAGASGGVGFGAGDVGDTSGMEQLREAFNSQYRFEDEDEGI